MALDMANSDASSATVKVLVSFYLVATDESSSRARTLAIHKEKFNASLSDDEVNDLSIIMKHLKTFTGLEEIAIRVNASEKNPRSWLSYRALSSYRGTKLQEPLKTRVNSKRQSKGPIYTLHLLSFVKIRPVNVFLWEKNRIRESDDKLCGMRDSLEKGAGMRDQDPPPPCQTL